LTFWIFENDEFKFRNVLNFLQSYWQCRRYRGAADSAISRESCVPYLSDSKFSDLLKTVPVSTFNHRINDASLSKLTKNLEKNCVGLQFMGI